MSQNDTFQIDNLKASAPTTQATRVPIKHKILRPIVNIASILIIILTILSASGFFFVYLPAKKFYQKVSSSQSQLNSFKQSIADKDISKSKQEITALEQQLASISNDYRTFSYLAKLPKIKDYYQDGINLLSIGKDSLESAKIVITAIEPYKDFLGLKGSSPDSNKTTEDRISFLTQTIEGLVPHLDSLDAKLSSINTSLNKIDISKYPNSFKNFPIQKSFYQAKEYLGQADKIIRDGKPILSKTSWLLGKDKPRTYFLIFQNDAELRPTGGFWTAYGLIKVDKGKITPLVSDDIYSLDAKFQSTIPAPRPIKSYHINVPYWNLRDMNLSPDFPESIKTFLGHYQKITKSNEKIDAVIAIDTRVLVDLVKTLGRVGVPGWGNFSADPDKRCDGCPQIIYQLEWLAGQPRGYIEANRKGFLSPLIHSLLANAMASEKSKIPLLGQTFLENIHQKHILFYFTDEEIQKSAQAINISGSITNTPPTIDYFHLNDANMSSAKTNLFLKQKIKHEIISQDGKIEHKITVTYTNPSKASNCNLEKGDLCLNAAKYRDWFRFFVPKGSTLQKKIAGSEVDTVEYEELDKQVFEGFYGNKYPLYAQSSLKTSIQYITSVKPSADYTLLLQKQPGTKPTEYELVVNNGEKQLFLWNSDKIIKLAL